MQVIKINISLIILLLTCISSVSQNSFQKKRDSLLYVLLKSKEDTNKIKTMIELGIVYIDNNLDSTEYFARSFGALSNQLHYPSGQANSLSMQAYVLSSRNKQDEAIALDLEAIEFLKNANLPKVLANVYNNTAIIYNAKGEYTLSLSFYLKAATIYEKRNEATSMAFIYSNISNIYNELKEYQKGYEYSLKGILLCRSLHQNHGLIAGMINLGSALINLQKFDTALHVLIETKKLVRDLNYKSSEIDVLANINYAYAGKNEYSLIYGNSIELMALSKELESKDGLCFAYLGLVDYYLYLKKYEKAAYYAQSAVQVANENNLTSILEDAYKAAAKAGLENGNLSDYYKYTHLKDSVNEVLLSDKILKNTQELEAQYSLNKKQSEIDILNKEKRIQLLSLKQHHLMIGILMGVVIVIGIISFLSYMNYQQKKKLLITETLLHQKRISELEKEKILMATQAMLQGQVEERSRLAKDLHDGLGGILSSAKFSFNNMKENMIITSENAEAFERSMGMLDKSINELRRVAHNMMPEALVKFGLDTALKDYCSSIEASGAIQLTYQSFDIDEASISKITAAAVYRIIQELVNNILKHANATAALVQLIRRSDTLSITVEDNGKGFDKTILDNNDGIGYINLKNRVNYLNGSLDIQSSEGNGTSVNIEIPNIAI